MKELFTLYYHRRILFTDFFSQSLRRFTTLNIRFRATLYLYNTAWITYRQ